MAFGKAFETRKEASIYAKKLNNRNSNDFNKVEVRKMSKKLFPRRKKLYHVGDYIDFINFA